jgi:hypothetical protein
MNALSRHARIPIPMYMHPRCVVEYPHLTAKKKIKIRGIRPKSKV